MEAGAKWMKKQASNPIKEKNKVQDIQDFLKEKSERDYILFALGVSTGYRAGDLVALQVRDIRRALEYGFFSILEGKKKNCKNIRKSNIKPRKAYIAENLEKALKEYIKGKRDYEYMFPSRKGAYIEVPRVTNILKDAGKKFSLKNITAHSMRKTYAYHLWVLYDYNTLLVKEMLGHSSIEETKKYLGLDNELYKNCSKALNDLLI